MRWKALDTTSEYQISDTGLLRRIHIFSLSEDKDGYLFTSVTSDQGERVNCRIHRLVVHAFDPRPNENELEVHHKDGNVQNNNIENLEWVTHEENIRLIPLHKKSSETQFIARPVAQYSLEGELIKVYPSINQANKAMGKISNHISEVCAGKRETTYGYRWRYFEGSTTNISGERREMEDKEDIV